MKIISSISEISKNYNYFIIDLWGVLHDGHKPYKNAVETLKILKNSGKKIALLSNAPRRAAKAKSVLENLGFSENLYDFLLTSGEITFDYVVKNYAADSSAERSSYFYIGPEKDRDILNGTSLVETNNAQAASFALVTGFNDWNSTFDERKPQADAALAAGLTLLCANPDRKVVKQTGEVQICAGLVAEYYGQQGGNVIYFGKPYKAAYEIIKNKFSIKNPAEVLCIGDSFHTDIKGGNDCGASSLLVAIGIHASEILESGNINLEVAKKLSIAEKAVPTYLISEFC